MSIPFETLLQEVLVLPSKERALIVKKVIDSLHDEDPNEVRTAWIEEIEQRLQAIERGEEKEHPGKEVVAELRRKYSS
jgi:putative addiction module component (TIGR02574 family)